MLKPSPTSQRKLLPLLAWLALLASATAPAADSATQVRVTTSMGDFVIELMPDRAPLTVANFLRYVREGFYTNTLFHRVVANFVIQGGGHSESAHSGNAQFYVNLVDNPELDPLPTRWGYAVFGHVVQGMDVVERIGVTPTGSMGPFKSDAPLKPVIIEKVEVIEATAPAAPTATPMTPPSQDTILSPK